MSKRNPSDWQLYFAYGSNMATGQMAERCPGAHIEGLALLKNHRFLINQRGYATIVPDMETHVHGVVWHLNQDHVASLDHYEDVALNLYRKESVTVETSAGHALDVMTYIAANSDHGQPRLPYIQGILDAARYFELPHDYIHELRTWHPTG